MNKLNLRSYIKKVKVKHPKTFYPSSLKILSI